MAESESLGQRMRKRVRKRWRAWLRAIHRDVGYLAVGLTFIYALSGLAINHIDDWNPNFKTGSRTVQIAGPVPTEERAAAQYVLDKLGIDKPLREAFLVANQLELSVEHHRILVDIDSQAQTATAYDDYEEPRFFLRVANWLHYNRGKKAWTYIADAYAILLLYLAISGIFMLKGRLGIRGRGAVLILAGAAVPIAYVVLSSGPGG